MKKSRIDIKKTIKKRIEERHKNLIFLRDIKKETRPIVQNLNSKMIDISKLSGKERTALRADLYIDPNKNNFLLILEKKKPVSIIITAYQTQDYIEECLDSIENQQYFINNNNYEILLGIDGCQDTLKKVLQIRYKYRNLRVFMMDSNMGTYITSNTLLNLVKYDNIIRFDSDDIMRPEMINEILSFNSNNDYDVIRYKFKNFGTYQNNTKELLSIGAAFFKRNIFDLFGGWESWSCSADYELLKRIEKHVKIGVINKILFDRRIHSASLTRNSETSGNSEIRKKYNNIINTGNFEEIQYINKTINMFFEYKLNICFIYDVKGWAFYNMSNEIKNQLTEFNIDIKKYDELFTQDDYDLIITFSPRVMPKNIKKINNIVCGISSHFGNHKAVSNRFLNIFTNDITIYNELTNSSSKFLTPNGINTAFFQSTINKRIGKKIKIATIGSERRVEHKGKERLILITEELIKLGHDIENISLFVDTNEKIYSQYEMRKYYNMIDIFIISSNSETGPNTLLEAMSMGIPVVSNRVGLAENLITNGITGYLIEKHDNINDYVLAIDNLIKNPDIYIKMSENCKIRIKEFDWTIMALNYKKMIYGSLKNIYNK